MAQHVHKSRCAIRERFWASLPSCRAVSPGGLTMKVKDIMTAHAEGTSPTTTLREAAQRMKNLDVGPLPVCGDDDRLAGMITDRDIAVRAVAEGLDPSTALVRDVMTPNIIYCYEDQDVSDAAHMMEQNQ